MSTSLKLFCVLIAILAMHSMKADASEEDSFDIFKLRTSPLGCPLPVIGPRCPEETPLYYFECCGRIADSCCFRLQDWALVALMLVSHNSLL